MAIPADLNKSALVIHSEYSNAKRDNGRNLLLPRFSPLCEIQKRAEPFLKMLTVPTKEQREKMRVPTYKVIA